MHPFITLSNCFEILLDWNIHPHSFWRFFYNSSRLSGKAFSVLLDMCYTSVRFHTLTSLEERSEDRTFGDKPSFKVTFLLILLHVFDCYVAAGYASISFYIIARFNSWIWSARRCALYSYNSTAWTVFTTVTWMININVHTLFLQ